MDGTNKLWDWFMNVVAFVVGTLVWGPFLFLLVLLAMIPFADTGLDPSDPRNCGSVPGAPPCPAQVEEAKARERAPEWELTSFRCADGSRVTSSVEPDVCAENGGLVWVYEWVADVAVACPSGAYPPSGARFIEQWIDGVVQCEPAPPESVSPPPVGPVTLMT